MSKAKFTKGPWQWEINRSNKRVFLSSRGNEVLRFERWGMHSAAPTFTEIVDGHVLQGVKAESLAVDITGREHHRDWCQEIDHPDAYLIAAAPEMYELLEDYVSFAERGDIEGFNQMFCIVKELLAKARGEK